MKQPASSCGFDGLCNGLGGCRRHPDGTLCAPGRCAGNGVVGGKQCKDGSCSAEATVACFPYGCDATTSQCFAKLRGRQPVRRRAVQGRSVRQEAAGRGLPGGDRVRERVLRRRGLLQRRLQRPVRQLQGAGQDGPVHARAGGVAGSARGLPASSRPRPAVPAGPATVWAAAPATRWGRSAGWGRARGASFMPPSVCDGQGTCEGGSPISCAPFLCKDGACQGTCTSAADCVPPNSCQGQSCGKKGLGQACRAATECGSGFCVDGVCCDSGCDGRCVFCAQPNALGRCVNVPADAADPRAGAGVTDPARICVDQGAASCGNNGRCDGQGGCASYANGTICQAESCDASANRYAIGTCRNGACAVASRSCTPNRCNGNQMRAALRRPTPSAPPPTCACGAAAGASRTASRAAASNRHRVRIGDLRPGRLLRRRLHRIVRVLRLAPVGRACARRCRRGPPIPPASARTSGRRRCGRDGVCDGRGQCRLYAAGTVCANSSCSGGMARAASRCDGMGMCLGAPTRPAPPSWCATPRAPPARPPASPTPSA